MEQLSKQQLVLLALLVSFVTSLATGIFTVSLMDQAPRDVVQTISKVVEKTIEKASPQQASVVATDTAVRLDSSVKTASASIVKIRNQKDGNITGLGTIVTKTGVILSDKSAIASNSGTEAIYESGLVVPITVIQMQVDGDIVFLAPKVEISPKPVFKTISFGNVPELGQSVFSLSGTSSLVLGFGITNEIAPNTSPTSEGNVLHTSIDNIHIPGSLLFDINGKAVGLYSTTLPHDKGAVFVSLKGLQSAIPSLK